MDEDSSKDMTCEAETLRMRGSEPLKKESRGREAQVQRRAWAELLRKQKTWTTQQMEEDQCGRNITGMGWEGEPRGQMRVPHDDTGCVG